MKKLMKRNFERSQFKWINFKKFQFSITSLAGVLLFFFLISCGGGAAGNSPSLFKLSGTITYDRVPCTASGLDFTSVSKLPVRRCVVNLIEASTKAILQTTNTNELGDFQFQVISNSSVYIKVLSESSNPKVKVLNNNGKLTPANPVVYELISSIYTITKNEKIDIHADNGNPTQGLKFTQPREAAPFAILDTCLKPTDFFLNKRPTIEFPELTVYWSIENTLDKGFFTGWSGSSNITAPYIYLLGDEENNTDEFDESGIIHEWAHYFQESFSRSDAIPGEHSISRSILTPTSAFAEGWGNALSAMVLYPNTIFINSQGLGQPVVYATDIDENNVQLIAYPAFKMGWFSEASVMNILFDLFDETSNDVDEPWDKLSLDAGTFYDIFNEDIKTAKSFTTLFTFISALKKRKPDLSADIDLLLAKHNIQPINDEFGSQETNDGGIKGSLAVYNDLLPGQQLELEFDVSVNTNELARNRYIKIVDLEGAFVLSSANLTTDSIFLIYEDGKLLDQNFLKGNDVVIQFKKDKTYVALINFGGDENIFDTEGGKETIYLAPQ